MTAQVKEDIQVIQTLLAQGAYQAVYDRYAAVWKEMLFVETRKEWMDFLRWGCGLEEEPLSLYLSAWRGECLMLGGFQGDVTEEILRYLEPKLPLEVWGKLKDLGPVVVDMEEPDGRLEAQLASYEEVLKGEHFALRVDFEDIYCAGAYFLSIKAGTVA